MSVADEMRAKLEAALSPTELVVEDVSEAHRGHAGFQEGGESHFDLRLRAAAFEGQSRIARHRMVHKALGADLVGRIHALSLDLDV
ncbi:MAG: BolA family protein [Sulfitobacter sp.]